MGGIYGRFGRTIEKGLILFVNCQGRDWWRRVIHIQFNIITMKQKLIMFSFCLFGFVIARANNGTSCDPEPGKKNEINGTVIQLENKKPLKGVMVTAVLASKKEKVIVTEDNGEYAFDELKSGTYKFIFEKAGFKKITKDKVVIKTDEAFLLNIEMIEADDHEIMPSPFHF